MPKRKQAATPRTAPGGRAEAAKISRWVSNKGLPATASELGSSPRRVASIVNRYRAGMSLAFYFPSPRSIALWEWRFDTAPLRRLAGQLEVYSTAAIGEKIGVHRSTIRRWLNELWAGNELEEDQEKSLRKALKELKEDLPGPIRECQKAGFVVGWKKGDDTAHSWEVKFRVTEPVDMRNRVLGKPGKYPGFGTGPQEYIRIIHEGPFWKLYMWAKEEQPSKK